MTSLKYFYLEQMPLVIIMLVYATMVEHLTTIKLILLATTLRTLYNLVDPAV